MSSSKLFGLYFSTHMIVSDPVALAVDDDDDMFLVLLFLISSGLSLFSFFVFVELFWRQKQ